MPKSTDATEAVDQAERSASRQIYSKESVLPLTAGGYRAIVSEAMRAAYDTTSALLQPPTLAVSLRFIEAAHEGSRHVLDLLIGTTEQTQHAGLQMWGMWAGHVERLLETAKQTTERLPDRLTSDIEQVVKAAQAVARQRETQGAREQPEQTLLLRDDHHLGGTAIIATATASGYCMKCKAQREIKNASQITMRNGRPATEGICPVCSTKIFKIGAIR